MPYARSCAARRHRSGGHACGLNPSRADMKPLWRWLVLLIAAGLALQLFFIGLIGEYVLSIHAQVRRGPAMFEIERINFDR